MRTIEIKVYKINEHPDKQKCFKWIRENWHDLNNHALSEIVDSLKALKELIGGNLDWSISTTPNSDQHITFENYDVNELNKLNADELPLTGVCWDYDIIEGFKNNDSLRVLRTLHRDTKYQYSDEGLTELCEANEYEFKENGEHY